MDWCLWGPALLCGGHLMSLCVDCCAGIDTREGVSEAALCPSLLQQNMLIIGVAALVWRSLEAE